VVFNIAAGYTETLTATISLTATGTAVNPLTFQKDPATSGANPAITAYTTGVATPASAVQDGIWRLLGSDYVTIDAIDLKDNPSNTTNPATMEYGFALYKASTSNGCQFVTIKNCVITLNNINNATGTAPMVDGSTGIIVMNALATAAITPIIPVSGGTNSNNKFYGNTIQNCNIGIALAGYAAASPFTLADNGNDIGGASALTGNTIINYGGASGAANSAMAIRTSAQYGVNISYNTINNNGSGTNHPTTLRGVFCTAATSANSTISYNTITIKGGGTTQAVTGIENSSGSTAAGNTVSIINNTITNGSYPTATTGGFYGINNSGTPATLNISNNTISNNSNSAVTTGFLYCIVNTGAAPTVVVRNNTISGNSTAALTTGLFLGVYNTAAVGTLKINSNTIGDNVTTAVSGVYNAVYNKGTATVSITIDSNSIGSATMSAMQFNVANSGAQVFINNTAGTAACTLSISNNNFRNVVYAAGGTGSNTYILNSAATISQAINNNSFTNLNVNLTGAITFISNSVVLPSNGTQSVSNNFISGSFAKSAGGSITLFTSTVACPAGTVINHTGNNFSNISLSGATTIAGWVNTDAGASTRNVQNNTFTNWTAATGTLTAISASITGSNSVSGNTINTISSSGAINGIVVGAGNNNVFSNIINTLSTTGASAVTGISINAGTSNSVYRNKIYDLQANNITGTVNGVLVSGTTVVSANIRNNLIGDLRTPIASAVDPIRGISVTATAVNSTVNVYNNTVYLSATSTGTNFGSTGIYHTANATATTASLNIRNNIITNVSTPNGTGLTVAYRRSTTALGNYAATSNNNLFFAGAAGTTRLIFYDGTNADQTLSAFKSRVASREAQSVTEDLSSKFLSLSGSSSSFLHLDPSKLTQVESGAAVISGVTIDYDGDTRAGNVGYTGTGTAPDIGADEFEGVKALPLSGIYTVGVGGDFTSITNTGGLFAAINTLGLGGNVTANIISDLAEDGSNILYQWTEQGAGNYTLFIQPDASTLRTVSGSNSAALIRLNGADRVTIDGSNGTTSSYLTIRNTNSAGTTATALTFINGSANNTIRYCSLEAFSNATNGVILFSTSTVAGGNSNNTVTNCNVNATVGANTGNVAIYSAGTTGSENSSNTISSNNIYNYRDRGIDIPATGSTAWTISGNSLYNGDVTGSINYAAASTLHGIRVLGGAGYSILNNYIGGNAVLAGGTAAAYASTLGNLSFQGILLTTTAASPASNIKGNRIANISLSSVPNSATLSLNAFFGIETNGSGINIGGNLAGEGNVIGSNTVNGSVFVTTTTALTTHKSLIRGINCVSTGGIVAGNQVGGIDIKNIGAAPGPSTFLGISVNIATAPTQVVNNIVGSNGVGAAPNSIRVLSTSTATATALTGISIGASVTSAVSISGNMVQNISHQSNTSSGSFSGISNTAATAAVITITGNTVATNTNAATAGTFYGIIHNAATSSVTISNNTVTGNSSTATGAGLLYGIYAAGASPSISITGNTFSNNTTTTMTGAFAAINSIATPATLNINSNSIFGNATTGTTGLFYAILNSGAATTSININSNIIGTSSSAAITFNSAHSGAELLISNTGGTAAAALSISNNIFQNINYAVASIGTNSYISNTAVTLSQAINGNVFTNMNVNTSGNIKFISNSVVLSGTGTQNVNNNSISGSFTKRAGGTITLFTSSAASLSGSVINNNNNNFSNITVTGATTIAGWVNTDAGASTKTIQGNTFTNWAGGTAAITGMSLALTGTANAVTANTLNNFTNGAAITGISSGVGNNNIYGNTINTFLATAAAAVTGIALTTGTNPGIYRNKIYDLQANTATGTVNGILVSGTTIVGARIYNNLIGDLRTPAASAVDPIRGISITATATNSTVNVYFNTVYLNATSTGTNFGTTGIYHAASATSTTAALNLRNNSVTNVSTKNGTGLTVAFRRSAVAFNNYLTTSNNNLFYAGTPSASNLICYNTTGYQTITTYKSAATPRDTVSVTENLTSKFLSTTGSSAVFLHMNASTPSAVESGAQNISGITDDFDGQVRQGNPGYSGAGYAPDIGADEVFGIEVVPPVISYTPIANTTSTTNLVVTGVTITDASGINITSGTSPRIYYKRFSDANALIDNTPNTNGWKYTEATNSTSPFDFMINYSLLYNGASVTAGIIQYFIVAQDLATTANVAINSGTFAVAPSSVALTSTAFPITGTINSYNIPFSGSYNVGTGEVFTTLTKADGLFASINSVGLKGNTTIYITSDLTEDGTNALNQWTETSPGNYGLTIQPDGAVLRTISGNVLAGLIRLNGADRVRIDGTNGGTGSYLNFKNTNSAGTTGTALSLSNGSSNDTVRYCGLEAYANAANGVILFGTSAIAGGNSNSLIEYCDLNATTGGNTGNVVVYSSGTVGNENSSNTISNNNIFNYRDRGIDITATGSSGWTISGNSFYNGDVSAAINYSTGSTLHGIRILGGSGYSILNNYIGGNNPLATGSNAAYSSTTGNLSFQGILLASAGTTPASYIKGNTISQITLSLVPLAANTVTFIGIETNGTGITIGGASSGDGNMIGSNTLNGSVVLNTTTSSLTNTSLIRGIYAASSVGTITGNQVGGFDIKNIGTNPASSSFQGIYINNATPLTPVSGNIVGSDAGTGIINSIRVLSTSTATSTSLNGIVTGPAVASALTISDNTIRNITNGSTTSSGSFTGIDNPAAVGGAVVTISNNAISHITAAANNSIGSAIYSGIASTSPSDIVDNDIDNIVLPATGAAAQIRGINVSGAFVFSISDNTISSLSTASTKTADVEAGNPSGYNICGILNGASVSGQVIADNTINLINATSTSATNTAIAGIAVNNASSAGDIYGNRIAALSNSATGTSTLPGEAGITAFGGTFNVYNNTIRIDNSGLGNGLKIYGLNHATTTAWNYFYNTIAISGTASGTSTRSAAFIRTLNGPITLVDNVLLNTRSGTGAHYAVSNITAPPATNWAAGASDYNDLYTVNTTTLGEWATGVNKTFVQWKTSSAGDVHSVSKSVSFISSGYDLQPDSNSNCSLNNAGTPVSTPIVISTDINGLSRNAVAPDLGAYEFNYVPFIIVPSSNSPVCAGSQVTLDVATGNAIDPTFSWKNPSNTVFSTLQSPSVIAVAGQYKVTVTDVNGCLVTDSVLVSLNTRPTAHMTGSLSICDGSSATLHLAVTGTGTIDGTLSSGEDFSGTAPTIDIIVTPDITTTYTIISLTDNNCAAISSDVPDSVTIVVMHDAEWTGAVSSNWNTAGNWLCGVVPDSTINAVVPAGLTVYPSITTGQSYVNDLTIGTGATVTVANAILEVHGDVTGIGKLTATTGKLIFAGLDPQTPHAAFFTNDLVKDLTINNSSGVTLGGTVKLTGILKTTKGQFTTGGYLTLISSATQTALIDPTGTGSVSGTLTMQRYLPSGFGYKYLSSPFQSATVNELANDLDLNAAFPVLYKYDENQVSSGFVSYMTPSAALTPLQGYAANFGSSAAAKTIDITGSVNNGSVGPTTLYNHNRTFTKGFNLVGNPYPSPIDWSSATGWTRTNVDNAIYYFNAGSTDQYTGTYSSYINGVSSDGVAGNIIPSMQGFFVHVTNGTYPVTASLAVNNAVRVTNLSPVFHKTTDNETRPIFRIVARLNDKHASGDAAAFYLDEQATASFEKEYDALKLMNTDAQLPNLYAYTPDGNMLSVDGVADPGDSSLVIPLGLSLDKEGWVLFDGGDMERVPGGLHIYFTDKQSGATQDLTLDPEYKVFLPEGKHENRFYLGLSRKDVADVFGAAGQELQAYSAGGKLFVLVTTYREELSIVNMLGQTVYKEQLSGNGYHEVNLPVSGGVYIVSLQSAGQRRLKKMILGAR
jgi:hypothetical protein